MSELTAATSQLATEQDITFMDPLVTMVVATGFGVIVAILHLLAHRDRPDLPTLAHPAADRPTHRDGDDGCWHQPCCRIHTLWEHSPLSGFELPSRNPLMRLS